MLYYHLDLELYYSKRKNFIVQWFSTVSRICEKSQYAYASSTLIIMLIFKNEIDYWFPRDFLMFRQQIMKWNTSLSDRIYKFLNFVVIPLRGEKIE